MNTLQEYWDACLIRSWRRQLSLLDAMSMFLSLTGKRIDECELLRVPLDNIPWRVGVRVFTAYHLPKINDRLWDQDPEKDLALLRKLQKSKYNTEKTEYRTNADRDLANERVKNRRNRMKNTYSLNEAINRNSATDWNVTKGAAKIRVKRK
jgi:hypothetical protein